MAQTFDKPAATDSFATGRSKWNACLDALISVFSGATEPGASVRVAYMLWADTTAGLLKQRNAADTAWVTLWTLASGAWSAMASLIVTGTSNLQGAVDCDSTLNADGAATFGSTVVATGALTANDGVNCSGTVAAGILTASGASTISGLLTANGGLTVGVGDDTKLQGNQYWDDVQAGVTAVNPPAQGSGAQTKTIIEVTPVGAANDCITLPAAAAGRMLLVDNRGANTMRVYPASSDKIESAAVDSPVNIASGKSALLHAVDSTQWRSVAGA